MLNQTADLNRVFQALADPGRRLMIERLARGPASVSELGQPLHMSLAAVAQHAFPPLSTHRPAHRSEEHR